MALNLAEILKLLSTLEHLGIQVADLFAKLKEHLEKERDEKKRRKLLDACKRRDLDAIRQLLWD